MNKKQSKRQRDIKTKLMAAVCMLLVSSIMMVSTTYAWFTLSTAPEVTGINTAVGANGNLEMALLPLSGNVTEITADTNQSMAVQPATVSNTTWGNLVKLDNAYGLESMSLYPSALNSEVSGNDVKIKDQPVSTPIYGADGRISEMRANGMTGTYQDGAFYEKTNINGQDVNGYGVRAIGTVSGMSPRNLAYRQAMATANTNASRAKSVASTSLNNNGSVLADVAITHALNKGSEQYTDDQVAAMRAIVNSLLGTDPKAADGALEYIEEALKYYILAETIAPASADANYEAIQTAVMTADLADLKDGKINAADGTELTVVVSANMKDTWIPKLETAIGTANTAQTELTNIKKSGGTYYTWDDVSPAMAPLINADKLLINGMTVATVMADPGKVAGSIMANGLNLTMQSGSGVYADIADFCGNYSAGIIIPVLKYGELEVENVEANMKTEAVSPTYLASAATAVPPFADGTGNGGSNPLTDFYGYIIDLAFRTNAADSWLQIQPDAVDRIYADGTNVNTMGHGATMAFTSADADNFTTAAVTRLMGAIRIVFFDTTTNVIINYGRLNADKATTDETGKVTMPIYLCDAAGVAQVANADRSAEGIMALNQNEVHQLSVMVYLDGTVVGNDDVAVSAAQSMVGTMNLQFSSSATLVAMDYADLKAGEGGALNGGATTPTTPAVTQVEIEIDEAYTAVGAYGTYGAVTGICVQITEGGTEITNANDTSVTIGGEAANYVAGAGWVVSAASAPTGPVAVVVTK